MSVVLVMDGLKRQDRRIAEAQEVEEKVSQTEEDAATKSDEVLNELPKERRSFLDKLTERVKDFLDNAE